MAVSANAVVCTRCKGEIAPGTTFALYNRPVPSSPYHAGPCPTNGHHAPLAPEGGGLVAPTLDLAAVTAAVRAATGPDCPGLRWAVPSPALAGLQAVLESQARASIGARADISVWTHEDSWDAAVATACANAPANATDLQTWAEGARWGLRLVSLLIPAIKARPLADQRKLATLAAYAETGIPLMLLAQVQGDQP